MEKESKEANENNKAFQEKVILEGQKGKKEISRTIAV